MLVIKLGFPDTGRVKGGVGFGAHLESLLIPSHGLLQSKVVGHLLKFAYTFGLLTYRVGRGDLTWLENARFRVTMLLS